jgi:hypothetical protein
MVGRKGLEERDNPKEAVPKYDHSVQTGRVVDIHFTDG